MHDCYNKVNKGCPAFTVRIVGQLIWREYFYTMSRTNHNYDKSVNNPICLAIPWDQNASHFDKWKNGLTGYPFIDAGIRQLNQEGIQNVQILNQPLKVILTIVFSHTRMGASLCSQCDSHVFDARRLVAGLGCWS